MNESWKRFLEDEGAIIENGRVVTFRDHANNLAGNGSRNMLADLSHFGLIRVSGSDALSFLHKQFINDVLGLPRHRSQLNGYCTPKGRLIATFRLLHVGDGVMLLLPSTMTSLLTRRLKPYVFRDDVRFDDSSPDLIAIGYAGPDAAIALAAAVPEVPAGPGDVTDCGTICVLRIPGRTPRFEMIGDVASLKALWKTLHTSVTDPVGASVWDALNIQSGTPIVYPETTELFLPQMINLDLIQGVSFKKGCFPGQEIVARTQHRGQIKRRMYYAHVRIDAPPPPGAAVQGAEESETGTIVAAERSLTGPGVDLLAVLPIGSFERTTLHLYDKDGPRIEERSLPYELTGN
ncbi:MAG: glycine cleavage T protein (aminomethyl transferase) [Gammaproteobacteria bacterium]|nr:MAG: glycine cleavage T protein (aminomethyl transferase) [Gammaproteobacteria bacterium]TND06937.1 MAG: glycine cleavage T protein (aminomethyl transferase) [Gammaproteobacteria bacterium]